MKKFLIAAVLAAVSVSAFAPAHAKETRAPKFPFCDKSISVAPGEDGDIQAVKEIRYEDGGAFMIPSNVYAANQKFFKKLGHGCLSVGTIEVTATGEQFLVYHTAKDECDGGNTFGIIVRDDTGVKVATIDDGEITCRK